MKGLLSTNMGIFHEDDQLIALMTQGEAFVFIKKGLLLNRTKYFRDTFSEHSSNKNERKFTFNVDINALTLYKAYLETGKMTQEMYDNDHFMSLGDMLGTEHMDGDAYELTVVVPLQTEAKRYSSIGYSYDAMVEEAIYGGTLSSNLLVYAKLYATALRTDERDDLDTLKKDYNLYIALLKAMILFAKTDSKR